MKKILIIIAAFTALVGINDAMAQSRTSYFMEGSYFRNDLNPALAPTRGYLALPGMSGVGMNLSTNFLSVDNFFYQRDGQTVTALHSAVTADDFLGKLPTEGKLALDTKVNILGVGFYSKKTFWTFGINANVNADASLPMDMFRVLKTLGNGSYDLGNTAIEANAYLDAYLGTSFRVHKNVSIGIKAKFLMGIATLDGQFSELKANVGTEAITATMNGTWRADGVLIDNSAVVGGEQMPFNEIICTDPSYIMSNINNFGGAIDVGTEVRLLNNHLKISAAITDLGFIKWSGKTQVGGTMTGDFGFTGINLESNETKFDTSFEMLATDAREYRDYTSMLNFSVNAGVEYNFLRNHIAIGLMSHTKFCRTMTYSELTASVNFRPTNWLSATVSHTFLNHNRPGVFGFALNIHPRVINIYAGVDFIDTQWVKGPKLGGIQPPLPRYSKSVNAYVGVGFNFARPKYMRKK